MRPRRAHKVDDNHGTIRDAFRALHYSVRSTAALGDGFPDLICAKAGETSLVEVKDGSKPPSNRCLTPDETDFHAKWPGEIYVIESVDQVMALHVTRTERTLGGPKK